MEKTDSAAAEPRRVVTQIVLTFTVEGDPEQKERTLTLSRDASGAAVDGVIWSRGLMDRLAYVEGPDRPKPVPRRPARPDDGWQSRGRAGSNGGEAGRSQVSGGTNGELSVAASTRGGGDEDCIWLHNQSCTWISLCDNPWPL